MCRKRTRGWSDESSVDSSDTDEGDGVDDGQREDRRSGGSDASEGGRSEGGVDSVDIDEQGDGNDQASESGSESIVTNDTDDHYASDELHEIHEYVDAEWVHQ